MKSKYIIITAIFIVFPIFTQNIFSKTNPYCYRTQSKSINLILKKEKQITNLKKLINIINRIDSTYADIYKNLQNNKKIIIFFDPAHGKLPDGRWQGGDASQRLSCTNKPEEFYSILFSRRMYNLLLSNKHLDVKSTEDFMEVLQGKSDIYNNIPFPTTVKLAKKAGAFIIISEHLNNVSMIHKASGIVNIPGLHITRDKWGRKVLKYVNGTYSGFLTLYNKLDASGFSKNYALKLKRILVKKGAKPNTWQFGAVADSRFSYFVDFPVSVIFESGFISNPEEEKKLRDPEYIDTIVKSQYNAFIDNIRDIFGVDISGDNPVRLNKSVRHRIELLKLSRIAIFYIKKGNTPKAFSTIRIMERKYGRSKYKIYIKYYSRIKKQLQNAEHYYNLGKKYKKRRKYRSASRYFKRSKRYVKKDPIFVAYNRKYSKQFRKKKSWKKKYKNNKKRINKPLKKEYFVLNPKKSSMSKPIILAIQENQSLKDAISLALSPNSLTLNKLTSSLKNTKIVKWKKVRKYSKKRKRKISYWKKRIIKIKFQKGIYIVKLNKKFKVTKVKRVRRILLASWKYQNQQFLKNSYFAIREKNKAL